MYRFTNEELDLLIYHFSQLFNYDYAHSVLRNLEEGRDLSITFYNSPAKRSFDVDITYTKSTEIEEIADAIIDAYLHRLD